MLPCCFRASFNRNARQIRVALLRRLDVSHIRSRVYKQPMAIFIGHTSALMFWRSGFLPSDFGFSRAQLQEKPVHRQDIIAAARELLDLCSAAPATHLQRHEAAATTPAALHFESVLRTMHEQTKPAANANAIDLLVPRADLRRRSRGVRSRIYRDAVFGSSFVRVSKNCYVSTPEACFLQLASELPYARLLMTGMELCGTFALNPGSTSGFIQRKWDDTLTTVEKLAKYLGKASGSFSSAQALAAARRLANNAASPAEAKTYLLLCLPQREGGYGIKPPVLNAPLAIATSGFLGAAVRHPETRRPDFLWPSSNFALEYDSDAWHSGQSNIARDSKRRSELEFGNIHVLTLTSQQLYNRDAFEEVARIVAKRIGQRLSRTLRAPTRKKQAKLRRELLLEM